MFVDTHTLLQDDPRHEPQVQDLLTKAGFADWRGAWRRIRSLSQDAPAASALHECWPLLLTTLSEAATPDASLVNFERYVQSVPDREELFQYLNVNPRAVEILIKLFVGSQFLTEILLRNPTYLDRLTQHKRVAEFKSRQDFLDDAKAWMAEFSPADEKLNAVRRYQRWELLRIGACDAFGLMDLKTVTVQLSLLADSIVQACLEMLADASGISLEHFAVLAFGKLGGEELNYSSDIDLVFIAGVDATPFWTLGQKLIQALTNPSEEGFLYRVDMRLRPWGRSGALVTSTDAYLEYLHRHGMLWEKQALLKARPIAGNYAFGQKFLERVRPLVFDVSNDDARRNIRDMKASIEAELARKGITWGEVKLGTGSIRDVEFVTQFLQLAHGRAEPGVRSINTLDALVRLADFGLIEAPEYRKLTIGYVFLRTIEHSLQLMHHKQTHAMPADRRELAFLARRLDFADTDQFVAHYQQHCVDIRRIFDKYIGECGAATETALPQAANGLPKHTTTMEPSYAKVFSEFEIQHHAVLLERLGDDNLVEVEARQLDDGRVAVTIVGFDQIGDLSMICGLLFVYGFDISDGNVFTADQIEDHHAGSEQPESVTRGGRRATAARRFVNVLTVRPPDAGAPQDVWPRYKLELAELLQLSRAGHQRDVQGRLAKRVAAALVGARDHSATLYPVEIDIDNESSSRTTVLRIRSEDTIGFLYELCNALTMAGIDIKRVDVGSVGNRVFDTLYVTDTAGSKIVDENRQREVRAATVLIKHFTHLLPRSPNAEAALLHFRDFLEHLFQQPNWLEEFSSLERTDVLDALAQLLGVSDFLWEDFLRLQHSNLFPVVKDIAGLEYDKPQPVLRAILEVELRSTSDFDERCEKLNAFKDREMFRSDMRHILGHVREFGRFSEELTDVAEVAVAGAYRIVEQHLQPRFGTPRDAQGDLCPLSICALGKCGGRELGYASDIELMFIYDGAGKTSGPEVITVFEYFLKLVETITHVIKARQSGIFEIDLRLRPYGRAGSLAVSFDAFRNYFGPSGAAWPYERQSLVKLRPIAGDADFGTRVVQLRDDLVYTGEPFDVAAMRALREKQVRQLVKAGTTNSKLSPGGLVDCEYLVQGLQITHGHRDQSLRATNTLVAAQALHLAGILADEDYRQLRDGYVFLRNLIDSLRMVRGHARDLTVPAPHSEEFEFLARRLGYAGDSLLLQDDLERNSQHVFELQRLLDSPPHNPLATGGA